MDFSLDVLQRIIYLENDFCVVTKLAGENSQTDIPKIFKSEIESRLNKEMDFIECPHRLDMPVSGVQIIALNKETFNFFTQNFSNNKIHKTYWAIVEGIHEVQFKTLQDFLVFNTKKQKAFIYEEQVRKSKKVILDFNLFGYSYPIFNLADTFIVIGIFILIILSFIESRDQNEINMQRK